MNRMFAIVEREMRKFFRSPVLMIMSMMLPLVQLVILGNAFGGKIRGAEVAVVDYDHGPQAVKVREAFDAVAVNIATFTTVDYDDENQAREDVRTGKVDAAIIIPAQYSRRVYAQDAPRIGPRRRQLRPVHRAAASSRRCSPWSTRSISPVIQPRVVKNIALQIVELYPYVEYMKFLLAGIHRAGHVYLRHDRRRHALHRRQGPRRPRGLSGYSHHQARARHGPQYRRRHQGRARRHLAHRDRLAHGRPRHHLSTPSPISNCCCSSSEHPSPSTA